MKSKSFEKILEEIDFFGQPVEFNINNKFKSTTFIGGLLTIIMILALFALLIVNFITLSTHSNPQSVQEFGSTNEVPQYILDKYNLPLAFSVSGNSNIGLNVSRYFKIEVFNIYGETDKDLNKTAFNYSLCKADNFPQLSEEKFYGIGLNTSFCIEDQNLNMEGSWGESYISYISFRVSICKQSENKNCASLEETREYLAKNVLFWNIYVLDSKVNVQNYLNPFSFEILNAYKGIYFGMSKIQDFYISNSTLISDDGLFLSTGKNVYESLQVTSSANFDYFPMDNDDLRLVTFDVMSSSNYQITYRSYTKITIILGTLGGVVQILRIMFTSFCSIFSKTRRDLKCINSLFYFDKYNEFNYSKTMKIIESSNNSFSNSSKIFNGKKHIKLKNLDSKNSQFWHDEEKNNYVNHNVNNANNIFDETNNDINSNISNDSKLDAEIRKKIKERLINLNKKHQNSLKFTFVNIIEAFICFRCVKSKKLNYKKLLFDKSYKIIHQYLDIIFIIKILNEFEILKKMIMNQEQMNIFELIEKQLITNIDSKDENFKIENTFKKLDYKVDCISNLRRRISSSPNMVSEIDKALNDILVKDSI